MLELIDFKLLNHQKQTAKSCFSHVKKIHLNRHFQFNRSALLCKWVIWAKKFFLISVKLDSNYVKRADGYTMREYPYTLLLCTH